MALYRGLDDKRGLARALAGRGGVELRAGELARAEAFYEEALEPARAIELWDLVAGVLNDLGEVARLRGDYRAARARYEEAVRAAGEFSARPRAFALMNLGMVVLFEGDCAAARSSFRDSLSASARLGDRANITTGLWGMAGVFTREGQVERAARLLGAAEALRKAINAPIDAADRGEYERTVAATRAALGQAAFSAACAEGEAMTMEQAIELALAQPSGGAQPGREAAVQGSTAAGGKRVGHA